MSLKQLQKSSQLQTQIETQSESVCLIFFLLKTIFCTFFCLFLQEVENWYHDIDQLHEYGIVIINKFLLND